VSKAGTNKQTETDILQCKVDILRARNITLPHDNTTSQNPETQHNNIGTNTSTRHTAGGQVETIHAKETTPLPNSAVHVDEKEEAEEASEIPRFDLAEEIMAEQRKITAIRRKAPGVKTEVQRLKPETRIDDHSIEQPKPLLSEQEKIIAEIVARDIEELCRGNYSSE
jgi:hypothetical protein